MMKLKSIKKSVLPTTAVVVITLGGTQAVVEGDLSRSIKRYKPLIKNLVVLHKQKKEALKADKKLEKLYLSEFKEGVVYGS